MSIDQEKIFQEKCQKIASLLEATLINEDLSTSICNRFQLKTGEKFYISFDSYRNKLTVNVLWPRNKKGDQFYPYFKTERPQIGLSFHREPEAIAKAIQKRFLPLAIPAYNKQLERFKIYEEHNLNTEKTKGEMENLIHQFGLEGNYNVSYSNSGGKIKLELDNLTLDQAREILIRYANQEK
jgi:hypothetical protein